MAATATHPITAARFDPAVLAALRSIDLVVPDGQPVRWALNALHGARMKERVYGPELMRRICERAAERQLGVFLYGSTEHVLGRLSPRLTEMFPRLTISGTFSPPFGRPTDLAADVSLLRSSGARIVFVGLGSPKQELWIAQRRDAAGIPLISVGAAFDFLAGTRPQAPPWMQRHGIEWMFRLASEPRRLFWRYAYYNPLYVVLIAQQLTRMKCGQEERR